FALVVVLAFFLLERAARVEQAAEQLLLPRDRLRVHARLVQRLGELPRFLGQLTRALAAGRVAQLLELVRDATLLTRQRPRRRLVVRRHLPLPRQRQEPLRLRVDRALLVR